MLNITIKEVVRLARTPKGHQDTKLKIPQAQSHYQILILMNLYRSQKCILYISWYINCL